MRATVTLWTIEPNGSEAGISEFVLYRPDEGGFTQRARNLFAMAPHASMPLVARLTVGADVWEIEATRSDPTTVARHLWCAYRSLLTECPVLLSSS